MNSPMWLLFALAGAFFAALVSVLAKRALKETDFIAGMLIQALGLLLTVAVAALAGKRWGALAAMPKWALGLLAAAGVAAGLSWLSGYRALQLADVAKSAPIDKLSLPIAVVLAMVFLSEKPSLTNWLGIGLMTIGAVLVAKS